MIKTMLVVLMILALGVSVIPAQQKKEGILIINPAQVVEDPLTLSFKPCANGKAAYLLLNDYTRSGGSQFSHNHNHSLNVMTVWVCPGQ